MRAKTIAIAGLGWCVTLATAAGTDSPHLTQLVQNNCIACHGPEKQKGKIRLDTLEWEPGDAENLELWQTVYDQIESGDMPPEDEPRPDENLRANALTEIQQTLASSALKAEPVVLRRLNRSQYRNALRDLLKIDVGLTDPTAKFPSDDEHEGFDVIGESLVMSDFLMSQQLEAARNAVALATFPEAKPEPVTVRTWAEDKEERKLDLFGSSKRYSENQRLLLWLNGYRNPTDPRGQRATSGQGVDQKGWYDFEIEVESRGRSTTTLAGIKSHDRYHKYNGEDLHCLEIYLVNRTDVRGNTKSILYERFDLPDNEKVVIKRRIWLEKDWRLSLAFGNGHSISDGAYASALKIDPKLLNPEGLTKNNQAYNDPDRKKKILAQRREVPKIVYRHLERIDGPRIIIHWGSRTGPVFESYPPESHRIVNGEAGESPKDVVRKFAERAFRRPVQDADLEPYFELAEASPDGTRDAIAAILCAPDFIYLKEREGTLDPHALASRMSFFLTHTIPDAELTALAKDGSLMKESVLRAQAERLLASEASEGFVEDFIWSWLKLQQTRQMAPGFEDFTEYHVEDIAGAMVTETNLFFRDLIEQNAPVRNLVDSDFTWLNSKLARYYGIGSVDTMAEFQRVSLRPEHRRGGLLGQASVLTASADGVETSPVTRGIWILENIMGTPPSPPPPGVETALAPDLRGLDTVREQLAKHRQKASCNECHKSIDPIGFALESFDPTGLYRTEYKNGQPVDSVGYLPDGSQFEDEIGLKRILLEDLTLVRRNLISKLLTYGTGRTMEAPDRAVIDRIAQVVEEKGDGVRDLIVEVVSSEIFRTK